MVTPQFYVSRIFILSRESIKSSCKEPDKYLVLTVQEAKSKVSHRCSIPRKKINFHKCFHKIQNNNEYTFFVIQVHIEKIEFFRGRSHFA